MSAYTQLRLCFVHTSSMLPMMLRNVLFKDVPNQDLIVLLIVLIIFISTSSLIEFQQNFYNDSIVFDCV